jgi:cellulose biosynthesis protein BcsQ
MIITIAQVKGGVGKTNNAIHIAAFMQTLTAREAEVGYQRPSWLQ